MFWLFKDLNKFKLFFQYKNKKTALSISNGLKTKFTGKYLAVLLMETSPYKYGLLTLVNPEALTKLIGRYKEQS